MKRKLKIHSSLACLALCTLQAFAATNTPSFEQYPDPVVRLKSSPPPRLVSRQDREYRTRIAEASREEVNFSGHYVLSSFGCGSSCVMSFALDKKSGKVSWLPFTVCCADSVATDAMPLSFRKDSRLLVVTGSRNEDGKGVYYYEFKRGEFVLVHEVEH